MVFQRQEPVFCCGQENCRDQIMDMPTVRLKTRRAGTFVYRKMIQDASAEAHDGDCVQVISRDGRVLGFGLYNSRSVIVVRMLSGPDQPIGESFWSDRIDDAVNLREQCLTLGRHTDAYRLIHAEGDGVSGLIVDRFGDVLVVQVNSLAIWQRIDTLLELLHARTGARSHLVMADPQIQKLEGFAAHDIRSVDLPGKIEIQENGVRYRVRFDTGHKTGFFCDQRDNRMRLARMAAGVEILDLCCYSGGFGVAAKTVGDAAKVTCVDIDESAIELARRNANLNQVRIETVQSDAFTYMRQMQANNRSYDIVTLDPPKLVFGRNDQELGRHKYSDLNRLAATLVRSGGLLLTCSCSGALDPDEFARIAISACTHAGRRVQILDRTGAAPDHPVSPDCPESAYLKALWLRIV